jgi:hypothetical protein
LLVFLEVIQQKKSGLPVALTLEAKGRPSCCWLRVVSGSPTIYSERGKDSVLRLNE